MGFVAAASWGLGRLSAAPQRSTAASLKSSCRINWTRLGINEPVWSLISNSWRLSTELFIREYGRLPSSCTVFLPFGWILNLPSLITNITAYNNSNNDNMQNYRAPKNVHSNFNFFIFFWLKQHFLWTVWSLIRKTALDLLGDTLKWKHRRLRVIFLNALICLTNRHVSPHRCSFQFCHSSWSKRVYWPAALGAPGTPAQTSETNQIFSSTLWHYSPCSTGVIAGPEHGFKGHH